MNIDRWSDPLRGVCFDPGTLLAITGFMSAAAPAIAVGGTILSAAGAIQSGNTQKAASDFQAAQLEATGKTENAAAQRQAAESQRQSDLMMSRARLVGAASGGGQDIPLLGQIEEEGALKVATDLWQGAEAAKGRTMQAQAARFEGSQYSKAGWMDMGTTILSGASSFADKYA